MRLRDRLRDLLRSHDVARKLSDAGVERDVVDRLHAAIDVEAATAPRIAIIGETGVGKSSTINALFTAGLPTSNTKACTRHETEIVVEGGSLVVIDMPGLGEDVESDKVHLETYARVLPTVDVVLWIIKADNRAMTNIQRSLRRLVRIRALKPQRLVLAINQVDLIQPGQWDESICQPSAEQEASIEERRNDIATKIRQAIRRVPDTQIIAYSALKRFNLELLLEALVVACDEHRRWVLAERAHCADFNELLDNAQPEERQ